MAATIWLVVALGIGDLVLAAAFRDYVERDFRTLLGQTIDAMIGVSDIAPDGKIQFLRPIVDQRFEEPYSGLYWQVAEDGGDQLSSRSLWDTQLDPLWSRTMAEGQWWETDGPDDQRLLMMVRDISLPGSDRRFRYMAAVDRAILYDDIHRFDALLAWSLGGLGLGLIVAILLQVTFGLRPLRDMRHGLSAVRTGRSHRLKGDFPPEVQPLVGEVNALLDHNEAIVERARTHAGNLAHALKTPLSVLQNEASGIDTPLGHIARKQTDAMRQHIDHHLRRARATGSGLGMVTALDKPLSDMVRVMSKLFQHRNIQIDLDLAPALAVAGSKQDLDEVLGNLMDNACKWARARVQIQARSVQGERRDFIEIKVCDDGPGVPDDDIKTLFERGRRLDESVPGTGLGLAITRDIVELNGGSVSLFKGPLGGLAAMVWWPAAPRS